MPSRRVPLVSVGMPVFNGGVYLEAAIRAIQAQTLDDFELIISDNASTDRTAEICRDLASDDARIVYHRNDVNIGAARNFNRVFELSRAPYFRWATADDECLPTLHEECLRALECEPRAVLAYGKTVLIDGEGRFVRDYEDNLDLRSDRPSERFIALLDRVGLVNVIYGLMRSDVVRATSLIRSTGMIAGDIHFMAELCLYGQFREVPKRLFRRRLHAGASSSLPDDATLHEYFWQGTRSGFLLPTWRSHLDFMRSAIVSPIDVKERGILSLQLVRRMFWARGALLQDVKGLAERWTRRLG